MSIQTALLLGAALLLTPTLRATVSIDPKDQSVTVTGSYGITRVQPWLDGTVRIQSAPGQTLPAKKSFAVIASSDATGWTATTSATGAELDGPRLHIAVNSTTGLVAIATAAGKPLLQEKAQAFQPATDPARNGLAITTTLTRQPGEHFYGGGVIGGGKIMHDDDLRDPTAVLSLENNNAHISIPILYSSLGYSFFWDNASRGKLNLTPDSVAWNSTAGDEADFYVMAGPTADKAIAQYRRLTGAAPLFPQWAYGFWFSRNKFISQDEILKAAADFRSHQFPIDLLVQDYFYWHSGATGPDLDTPATSDENWGSHEFSTDRYPDVDAMINELHQKDHIHFMAVIWAKFNPSTEHFQELDTANGLFPPSNDWAGKTLQYYDPYDPNARQIYGRQVMDSLFPHGVDAFWMDGAEPEIKPEIFAAFDSPAGPVARVMNAFPLLHVSSVYEAQRYVDTSKRVVLLPRSAWAGTQRYAAAAWTGDIRQDWKTLAWQIEGLQNYSITGIPYITTDVGGYKRTKESTPELFVRWFQWGTFCPIFRVHGVKRPFPWEYGADAEAILQKFDLLRYRLLPYIYTQAGSITQDSGTLLRPLVMDFQDDAKALDTWDEFLFGPSILVCPVYGPGQVQRDVYLPGKGDWYDFWTGERMAGGQSKTAVPAPLARIPLYVRAGSILPMGPEEQYAGEKPGAPIELRIYPGADGAFSLYEDSGDSYAYEKGAFARIPMKWNNATRTLTLGDRTGSFPGVPAQRTFRVVVVKAGHGTGEESSAIADQEISYQGKSIDATFKP